MGFSTASLELNMKIEKFIKLLFATVAAYLALLSLLLFLAYMGFVLPQIMIGNLFDNGYGVPKNHKFAFYWYQRATEKSIEGKYLLGAAYSEGTGVEVNYEKALPLIKESAEAGLLEAQMALGNLLSTSKHKKYSYIYYTMAVNQGSDEAKIQKVKLIGSMSKEEIAEAEKLFAEACCEF